MISQKTKHFTDQLRNIPLTSVLSLNGAQPDKYDNAKWHTNLGVISINGPKFINWNLSAGGGGAIDLVMHLRKASFQEALLWLEQHFLSSARNTATSQLSNQNTSRHDFLRLPQPDPSNLEQVLQYLTKTRAIPL